MSNSLDSKQTQSLQSYKKLEASFLDLRLTWFNLISTLALNNYYGRSHAEIYLEETMHKQKFFIKFCKQKFH